VSKLRPSLPPVLDNEEPTVVSVGPRLPTEIERVAAELERIAMARHGIPGGEPLAMRLDDITRELRALDHMWMNLVRRRLQ
jgi:hypothetical protein